MLPGELVMDFLKEALNVWSSWPLGTKVVIGGAAVGGLAGAPKVLGFTRALWVGWRSQLFWEPRHASQRTADVAALRNIMHSLPNDYFINVFGEKGVGKTTIIETVTAHRYGVFRVPITPQLDRDQIKERVFREFAHVSFLSAYAKDSAARVIFWHRLLFGRPVVILSYADLRSPKNVMDAVAVVEDKYTRLSGAARELAEFGFLPIVDASSNSQDADPSQTGREELVQYGPMSKEVLLALEQYQTLYTRLREVKLSVPSVGEVTLLDAVWNILGGVPIEWDKLVKHIQPDTEAFAAAVKKTVMGVVEKAAERWDIQCREFPYMEPVHNLFADADAARGVDSVALGTVSAYLKALGPGNARPLPDKVLRVVSGPAFSVLEPASPTMGVVLRLRLTGKTARKLTFDHLVARIHMERPSDVVRNELLLNRCYA